MMSPLFPLAAPRGHEKHSRHAYLTRAGALLAAGALTASLLVGCSTGSESSSQPAEVTAASSAANPSAEASGTTVENCGRQIHIPAAPHNVALMKPASVTTLAALGVLDRVSARAGAYPEEYFTEEVNEQLRGIPTISDKLDPSGHLQISREEVMAVDPDLVVGRTDTVNAQTMASSGVPLVEEPAFCEGGLGHPASFEDVWEEIRLYGTIFDRAEQAEATIAKLKDQVAALEAAPGNPKVAVLYPTVGGGVTYAYGTGSMANPVVEAAGGTNVYDDQADRVFEVTAEDIVDRNPDYVIALYSAGDPEDVVKEVRNLAGFSTTSAGAHDRILPLLLNFVEPPTPLAVEGTHRVHDFLADK